MSEKDNDPIIDEGLSNLYKLIDEYYWVVLVNNDKNSLSDITENLEEDCKQLQGPFISFTTNLKAAQNLLNLPYKIAARNGPALPTIAPLSDLDKLNPEKLKQYREALIEQTKFILAQYDKALSDKKSELKFLMYQACILIWSALENFCKDVFIQSLNQRPELYTRLQNNPRIRDSLSIPQASWQRLLEEHNYDLNEKLGYIVANNKDFSSPKLLQEVFHCIFEGFPEDKALIDYFKDGSLWLLGQRRNLIVHRCGIVDQEYINKTNDNQQKIGNSLVLRTLDIEQSMGIVRQCGIGFYANARHCWPRPENPKF